MAVYMIFKYSKRFRFAPSFNKCTVKLFNFFPTILQIKVRKPIERVELFARNLLLSASAGRFLQKCNDKGSLKGEALGFKVSLV